MIKNFIPKPYEGTNPIPEYAKNVRRYALRATLSTGYDITLGELTVGSSVSAGNPLAHALFESYSDHGKQSKAVRTRASGCDAEFAAVKNAMIATGVEFHPSLACPCETILESLGEWFKVQNSEIAEVSVVSQTCH